MPTIDQLAPAPAAADTDELVASQSGTLRRMTRSSASGRTPAAAHPSERDAARPAVEWGRCAGDDRSRHRADLVRRTAVDGRTTDRACRDRRLHPASSSPMEPLRQQSSRRFCPHPSHRNRSVRSGMALPTIQPRSTPLSATPASRLPRAADLCSVGPVDHRPAQPHLSAHPGQSTPAPHRPAYRQCLDQHQRRVVRGDGHHLRCQ